MGYSASYIIPRFVKYAGKPHGKENDGKNGRLKDRFPDGSGSSLYYASSRRGDGERVITEIQSYGSHFPLARLYLYPDGRRKMWLLNGDRWGGSGGWARSNEHNDMAREAVQATGDPWFIIPFSAMTEAGIQGDTIIPVEVLPERAVYEHKTATSLDGVPHNERKVTAWFQVDGDGEPTGDPIFAPRAQADGQPATPSQYRHDMEPGTWYVSRRSILNGWEYLPIPGPAYSGRLVSRSVDIQRDDDGLYHYWEYRHYLGESVFIATYTRWDEQQHGTLSMERYFLAAFDTNEPRPLWFLAELPYGARPRTVDQAREALKPGEVKLADRDGIVWQRQGDVFAIPTTLTTRDLPGPSQRSAYVLDVNHVVTEVRYLDGKTYGRGRMYHRPREWGRTADHRTIDLGDRKTWHLLVRNTVPMRRAWSLGGNVD